MGKLLLPLSCQKTLPSAGWLDCATALVPPREAMEEHRLEALSDETAAGRGVQAGRPRLSDTVASGCAKPIHESWMRENCTSSLSGGRRRARRQRSAPPPTRYLKRETNNSRDRQRRIVSDPGKDVRGRFGTGSVETDEKGAWRWKVPYVKNPNVTPRGDCLTIFASKVRSRRSTHWWIRFTRART